MIQAQRLAQLDAEQAKLWRNPAQIVSQWKDAADTDPRLLQHTVRGAWWQTLAECGITLLVTREYEHLVMAMRASSRGGAVSYLRLPHPSGLVADRARGTVHIASTRNPNQVYELAAVTGSIARADARAAPSPTPWLTPVASRFYPGCLYLHDLAMIGGKLHGNAVGHNAVVRLGDGGQFERVWWPACIEQNGKPRFDRNYLQLNSIAAGADLAGSFFSASCPRISRRRPGHLNFPVDRRGVIFSGRTREPQVSGLTRPHSARFLGKQIWVANSGYGELGFGEDGKLTVAAKLPGWTRGLCFCGPIAFVGTSRVIPRFACYAPGLDVSRSLCGIHAVDTRSGKILGSLLWPWGNQIFAIDWLPQQTAGGFLAQADKLPNSRRMQRLLYAFAIKQKGPQNHE
jgi:uncharacterized protein (TIGR03032 family)